MLTSRDANVSRKARSKTAMDLFNLWNTPVPEPGTGSLKVEIRCCPHSPSQKLCKIVCSLERIIQAPGPRFFRFQFCDAQ